MDLNQLEQNTTKFENQIHTTFGSQMMAFMKLALKKSSRQTIYLTLFGIAIPHLFFELYLGFLGENSVTTIKNLAFSGGVTQKLSFMEIIEPLSKFTSQFILFYIIVFIIQSSAYLGIIDLTEKSISLENNSTSARKSFITGLKLMPRWLFLVIISGFILFLTQLFFIPMLIISILLLMSPVILVLENKGVFFTFKQAILMKYTKKFHRHRWSLFFQGLSMGMAFYLAISTMVIGYEYLKEIDVIFNIPRDFFIYTFEKLPFGPAYLVSNILLISVTSTILALFGILTTSFYILLKKITVLP